MIASSPSLHGSGTLLGFSETVGTVVEVGEVTVVGGVAGTVLLPIGKNKDCSYGMGT